MKRTTRTAKAAFRRYWGTMPRSNRGRPIRYGWLATVPPLAFEVTGRRRFGLTLLRAHPEGGFTCILHAANVRFEVAVKRRLREISAALAPV